MTAPVVVAEGHDPVGTRLLDAAAAVFAERGYDGAGVAEIARRAGVTTGAIYNRFSGKAELLVSALDAHTTDELDVLFADHRFQGHTEDIIRIAGSRLVVRDESSFPALLVEAFVASRRHPELADLLRELMVERQARLAEIIESAKAGGGIDASMDTDSLVAFCHAVGFGFLLFDTLEMASPPAQPWEALIARLVTALGTPASEAHASPPSPPVFPPPTSHHQTDQQTDHPTDRLTQKQRRSA